MSTNLGISQGCKRIHQLLPCLYSSLLVLMFSNKSTCLHVLLERQAILPAPRIGRKDCPDSRADWEEEIVSLIPSGIFWLGKQVQPKATWVQEPTLPDEKKIQVRFLVGVKYCSGSYSDLHHERMCSPEGLHIGISLSICPLVQCLSFTNLVVSPRFTLKVS